jgi:hypothetical protein
MQVSISALAMRGDRNPSIGGQNNTLALSETEDDEIDRDSGYQRYTGVFTAPSASASPTSSEPLLSPRRRRGDEKP